MSCSYFLVYPSDILVSVFCVWFEKKEIGNLDSAYCSKYKRQEFLNFFQSSNYFVDCNICLAEINPNKWPSYVKYNVWLGLRCIKLKEILVYRDKIDCSSFNPVFVQKLILMDARTMHETKLVNCFNLFLNLVHFHTNDFDVSDVFFHRVNQKILGNLVFLSLHKKTLMTFDCIHTLSIVCSQLTHLTLSFQDEVKILVDTYNDWSNLFIANRFKCVEFNLGFNSLTLCGHILNCLSRFQMTSIVNCQITHSNFDGMTHDVSMLIDEFTSIVADTSDRNSRLFISVRGVHFNEEESCIVFEKIPLRNKMGSSIMRTRTQVTLESLSFYVNHQVVLNWFLKCNIDYFKLYDVELTAHTCKLFTLQCHAKSKLILDRCVFDVDDFNDLLTASKLTNLSITCIDDVVMYHLVSTVLGKQTNYLTFLCLCGSGFSFLTTQYVLDIVKNCKSLKELKVQQNQYMTVDWDYLIELCMEMENKVLIKFW